MNNKRTKIGKNILELSIIILLLGITYLYKNEIASQLSFIIKIINPKDTIVEIKTQNEYTKKINYDYVQTINKLDISKKQDLLNAYYSIIDSGVDKFEFYCRKKYKECTADVKNIIGNQTILSNINSFVHPYNSFASIKTKSNQFGKIILEINKSYSKNDIKEIEEVVNKIISENIKSNMSDKEKIKVIHDYIIKHSKYDKDRSDRNIKKYKSDIAYGPLLQGYGICGGYTDAMAIFLNKFEIPNFKVISENHIWNAVYLDGKWYHLDLTWDDPVDVNGADVLEYNIFLITTDELKEAIKDENSGEHNYDKEVFKEVG